MAKARLISTRIWQSETFNRLSLFERLLWIGLITVVDDQGRIKNNPILIRSLVFPMDDVPVDAVKTGLQALAREQCTYPYRAGGQDLIQLVNWWQHQPMRWAHPSDLPAPEGWTDRVRVNNTEGYTTLNWDKPGGFAVWPSKEPEPRTGDIQGTCISPVHMGVDTGVHSGTNLNNTNTNTKEAAAAADGSDDDLFADVPPPAPPQPRTAEQLKAETLQALARNGERTTPEMQVWAGLVKDMRQAEALAAFCELFGRTAPNATTHRKSWVHGIQECVQEIGYVRLQPLMAELARRRRAGQRGYDFAITDPHSILKTLMALRDEAATTTVFEPPTLEQDRAELKGSIFDRTMTKEDWAANGQRFQAELEAWQEERRRRNGADHERTG